MQSIVCVHSAHIMTLVKHGVGSIILWGCVSKAETGTLVWVNGQICCKKWGSGSPSNRSCSATSFMTPSLCCCSEPGMISVVFVDDVLTDLYCLFFFLLHSADCKNNTIAEEQKQLAWLVMETLTVLLQGSNTTNTNAGKHAHTLQAHMPAVWFHWVIQGMSTRGTEDVLISPEPLGHKELPNSSLVGCKQLQEKHLLTCSRLDIYLVKTSRICIKMQESSGGGQCLGQTEGLIWITVRIHPSNRPSI